MNRGAWLETEEIVECYRDITELLVIGGVIWGDNPTDEYFVKSHGVKTPDAYWKVVIRGSGQNEQAIAWIVPNSKEAICKNVNQYLVTVHDIERITGEKIPVAEYAKDTKPAVSWTIPIGCNKGQGMIGSISDSLLIIMGESDRIVALMQEVGVYDQMQLAQQSGQDVVLVSGCHIFIWSIDEYIYYYTDNPVEREQVILEFKQSANEITTSTRH